MDVLIINGDAVSQKSGEASNMREKRSFTNPNLEVTLRFLKLAANQNNAAIWDDVAEYLSRPRRKRAEVNLYKIAKLTKENETVVVPGKVLANGTLDKKVTVAAWAFSEMAKNKIEDAGGRAITLFQLVEENPKGSRVKIIL